MAKDNRKIHSGIRHEGTTYKAGMEDELSENLTQKQLDRLTEKGSISGNWTGAADDVDDDLTEGNEGSEQVNEPGAQEEAPAVKKSSSKKSEAKKSSSKKSAR